LSLVGRLVAAAAAAAAPSKLANWPTKESPTLICEDASHRRHIYQIPPHARQNFPCFKHSRHTAPCLCWELGRERHWTASNASVQPASHPGARCFFFPFFFFFFFVFVFVCLFVWSPALIGGPSRDYLVLSLLVLLGRSWLYRIPWEPVRFSLLRFSHRPAGAHGIDYVDTT
jgi:hypothetical protein